MSKKVIRSASHEVTAGQAEDFKLVIPGMPDFHGGRLITNSSHEQLFIIESIKRNSKLCLSNPVDAYLASQRRHLGKPHCPCGAAHNGGSGLPLTVGAGALVVVCKYTGWCPPPMFGGFPFVFNVCILGRV